MNIFKQFSALGAFVLVALAVLVLSPRAAAQPYFTNSNPVPGPYQYNNNYVAPYNASGVISNQVANGICTGTIAPGTGGALNSATVVSNNFYCYYSQPPTVTASDTLLGTNGVVSIVSVTKTNFVLDVTTTNCTVYWMSVGH